MADEEKKEDLSRRDFMSNFAAGIGIAAVGVTSAVYGFKYLVPPSKKKKEIKVLMAKVNEIKPGEAKEFLDGQGRKALLVNQNGKIKAFSKICTHLGCEVEWKPEENIFFCPCHLGKFDANGKNIAGPPPRPLDQFKVEVKDNYVFVTLIV